MTTLVGRDGKRGVGDLGVMWMGRVGRVRGEGGG